MPPSYNQILNRVERLMNDEGNISIDYIVSFKSSINGLSTSSDGFAHFVINNSDFYWNNSLLNISGSFYDLKPSDVLKYMRLSDVNTVESYNENISCYLLNALLTVQLNANLLVNNSDFTRLMVCFNKLDGYPDSYTVFVSSDEGNVLVSYKRFNYVVHKPKTFNESMIELGLNESQ